MTPSVTRLAIFLVALVYALAVSRAAQLRDSAIEPAHAAIRYEAPATDRVSALGRRLASGETSLAFDSRTGYLPSLLALLDVPVQSQLALFSGTSLQGRLVNSRNPRSIYFNDSVVVAWMPGGFIELASHDARQGAIFHLFQQSETARPLLFRDGRCLGCHYSAVTLGVPGFLVRSIPSAGDGMILPWLGNYTTDHRSPIEERWGGWYVTGRGGGRHLGNAPVTDRSVQVVDVKDGNLNVLSLTDRFDTSRYLSPYSDIVALLVFDHQMQMMNLLTRLGWEARTLIHARRADAASALRPVVGEVVDYLLFVDEAPLERVQGVSGFAERFSAAGPRDGHGRSLRDFDLERRLFRYPCSYSIYSEAFDALPPVARDAVYLRLWDVLSGQDASPRYSKLTTADREAIIQILRDTKRDLPPFFTPLPSRP